MQTNPSLDQTSWHTLNLPDTVRAILAELLEHALATWGESLVAAVLFGSAAEGRLRAYSDVNLILVFGEDQPAPDKLESVRAELTRAYAVSRIRVMFLRRSEIERSLELFAVKFADIRRRHFTLYGADPFADARPSREALRRRVRQTLFNLILRGRARAAYRDGRPPGDVRALSDLAGPLRSAAATLLELEGTSFASPREALEKIAAGAGPEPIRAVAELSKTRENNASTADALGAYRALLGLAEEMLKRAEKSV